MSIFRQWCHLFSLVDDDRCVLVPVDYCTENAVRQGARDTGELAKLVVWASLWIGLLFLYCYHCALRFSKQSLSTSQISQEPEGPAPCHQLYLQWEMWWHDMNVQMPTRSCIAKEPCLWLYCSLLWLSLCILLLWDCLFCNGTIFAFAYTLPATGEEYFVLG